MSKAELQSESIARWWIPYTLYYADYTREGVMMVYHGKAPLGWMATTLEDAESKALANGFMRCIGEA